MSPFSMASVAPAGMTYALSQFVVSDSQGKIVALRSADDRKELVAVVERVAHGDRSAMKALYERTSAKLYGICLRVLGSTAEAEEVLQDVYLTVWRKADSFSADKASPITWLSVMARNRAIDRIRMRRIKSTDLDEAMDIAADDPSAFDLAAQAEDRERLSRCLDELDERPRSAIRSAFLDGATYNELAKRESVPLGTMKSWIRRGLQSLRGCLER